MKLRIISLCAAIAVCSVMKGQQTDPTLTGAVAAQTEILKKMFTLVVITVLKLLLQ